MTERGRAWRRAVGVVAAVDALAALGGAVGLAAGWIDVGDRLERRLPLESPALGGVALAVLVAGPALAVTVAAYRRSPLTAAGSIAAGLGLVLWIAVETAFLRVVTPLQVTYVLVGLVQVGLGARLARARRAGRGQPPVSAAAAR